MTEWEEPVEEVSAHWMGPPASEVVLVEEEPAPSLAPPPVEETGEKDPYKDKCPICLGDFDSPAFLDQCFHKYCFICILQWAEVVRACPLCKSTFSAVIHDVRSATEYERTRIESPPPAGSRRPPPRPARRPWGGRLPTADRIDPHGLVALNFRRTIYARGARAMHVGSNPYSRNRDISAAFFKKHPDAVDRLIPWIRRDLHAILGPDDEGDEHGLVLQVVLAVLVEHDLQSEAAMSGLRPYLLRRTENFVHELVSFARSSMSMADYDSVVQYQGVKRPTAGAAAAPANVAAPAPVAPSPQTGAGNGGQRSGTRPGSAIVVDSSPSVVSRGEGRRRSRSRSPVHSADRRRRSRSRSRERTKKDKANTGERSKHRERRSRSRTRSRSPPPRVSDATAAEVAALRSEVARLDDVMAEKRRRLSELGLTI